MNYKLNRQFYVVLYHRNIPIFLFECVMTYRREVFHGHDENISSSNGAGFDALSYEK